jgi:AcrR family transcriptional regulator
MVEDAAGGMRERILMVAKMLFAQQGYAGTSIADIASELGTTKAAMYYYFSSKEEILVATVAPVLDGFARVVELAKRRQSPEELLGALIDLAADSGGELAIFGNDPSVITALQHSAGRAYEDGSRELLTALAGEDPSPAGIVRARAAFAVAKESGNLVTEVEGVRVLDPEVRAELLAAAMRVLGTERFAAAR